MFPLSPTVSFGGVPQEQEAINMVAVAGVHCATGVSPLPGRVSINFALSGHVTGAGTSPIYQRYRNKLH